MARRRLPDEPISKLATWSRRLALFSVAAALIAIIIVRAGLIEALPGLATFGGALAFAGIAILLALASFVVIWRQGLRGLGYAVTAIVVAGLLLAYPAYLGYKAYTLPPIYDITTDVLDPPAYDAVRRLRSRTSNPVQYAGLHAAELQREAYPDIAPLELSVAPKMAYDHALALVNKRRWLVLDAREPQKGRDGRIEAVARTAIMGFREDIVIRIRGTEEDSQVDMRSSTRYGYHDLGGNASRIRSFLDNLEENVNATLEREERRRPPEKKAPPTVPKGKAAPAKPQAKR
ncbi:DUF1499 domain-containing protein [Pseudorhodoplanes sp.]|jgi:uncharacterized protein (DUF1499 family)|uniref:DUF1499 domain-containing protein n=1 Tax=Pseudorhodoplanes sp. TaxID=1934341 RepID=UPI002BB96853|nr:DUF1499 domain-containing protein [Pseudorhodoplanes sp.]HWV41569.1 DUF1499 domain-containing protein [Pseudorhodoplanes sp.]